MRTGALILEHPWLRQNWCMLSKIMCLLCFVFLKTRVAAPTGYYNEPG